MTKDLREQQELASLILAAVAGEASEEELARIDRLVIEDEEWSIFFLQLMSQEAWLAWHATEARSTQALVTQPTTYDERVKPSGLQAWHAELHADAATSRASGDYSTYSARSDRGRFHSTAVLAASLLIAIGAVGGAYTNQWLTSRTGPNSLTDPDDLSTPVAPQIAILGYEARVMRSANCVWSPAMGSRLASSTTLQSGDSLNLVAGLAELQLNWANRGDASLRLEGPAGLVMLADGNASLNYGKLTATVALQSETFAVETPIGSIEVQGNAHFGVAVSSGAVEVHVFGGWAEVVTSGISSTQSPEKLRIPEGESLRMSSTESGEMNVVRKPAAFTRFASQVPMEADLLEISEDYADAIKSASPEIYWRFNAPVSGLVRNEMSNRYSALVVGKPNWVEERDNMTVEFGAELDVDAGRIYVVVNEPLQTAGENYTIELWAKPGHYHLGSMVALATPPGNPDRSQGLHGALLELGGPRVPYSSIEHPGRVRFLHRDPPTWDPNAGTSCFSNEPYGLRKWQHFVAVKDGSRMRLYVDGVQVATAEDKTSLSGGLELLVGQIDRERNLRPFIGQVDELAFYGRALTEAEIQRHHQLARPEPKKNESI